MKNRILVPKYNVGDIVYTINDFPLPLTPCKITLVDFRNNKVCYWLDPEKDDKLFSLKLDYEDALFLSKKETVAAIIKQALLLED